MTIGGGMLTLLVAAMNKKNQGKCSDYRIVLNGDRQNLFIDKPEVERLLVHASGGAIKGQPITSFNLHELENRLEKNTWVSNAELYFDNQDVLHVTITEKQPIARVFTTEGGSFYLDSLGQTMPLSSRLSARVPVFTGFTSRKNYGQKDSMLAKEIVNIAGFVYHDPFWMAQVSEIDITPERTFEMIPVIGNHRVKLGNGEHVAAKFRRLYLFYSQVLSKTGMNKYPLIDVQYAGQVVVSHTDAGRAIDSVQLRKNVDKLPKHARDADGDTIMRVKPLPAEKLSTDADDDSGVPAEMKRIDEQEKIRDAQKTAAAKLKVQKPAAGKTPKAVMPPKKDNNISEYDQTDKNNNN
jgi:cell division protein FtsQ